MKEIRWVEIPRFPYPVLCLLLLFCAGMDKTHAGETPAPLPAAKSAEPFPIGCRQLYAGTVGGSAVEMVLGRNRGETECWNEDETRTSEPADGEAKLAGYYYYLKTGRTDPESGRRGFELLWLTGQLDRQGKLDLAESVAGRDTPTGRFKGSTSAAGEIKGTWSDAGGKRSLPFSLRKLDGAARNGAVAFCTACAEKAESESCANVIVKIPGEAPLEMGPVFENEDRYEIDSSAVMNSASVLLLPGRPALYHVTVSSEPSCSGPSGLLHGEEHYFYIRGGRTQPVLTFSGGRRSNREGDFYRFQAFSYQGSELKAFEAWGEYCGPGPNCPVGDTDRFYMSRKLSLQRYRIEGMGAVPIGDIPLREESVIAFGQSEQPTPTISFVDDGTAGWLEFSTDYPLNLDSTALLLADQRWLDLPDQTPLPPRPGRWCWLYARVQPRGKPSPWHPVMPRQALQQAVAIAEFDPAEVEFVTAGTENNDETQNSAVAVWLNGHLLGFVVGAEQTCYSQGVRQAGPWGQLLDQKALNLYRRLFPPPFPETHRIVFAPGHSSATLHGVVEGGSAALYGARARKGQTLAVTADAEVRVRTIAGRDVRDDAPDPTRVVARLLRGGDYVIQATPAAGKTEFKLTVEIR